MIAAAQRVRVPQGGPARVVMSREAAAAAVRSAGSVAAAARALKCSRATVLRKLGRLK